MIEAHSLFFRLLNYHPGKLFRGTIVISVGTGLRFLGQTCVFVVVARILGSEEYGAYAAIISLAMAFGSFSGLGASVVMLQNTARDPSSFENNWRWTLTAWLLTFPLFFVAYGVFGFILFPTRIESTVIVFMGISEIIISPLVFFVMHAFQGHERSTFVAYLSFLQVATRLVATGILLIMHHMISPPSTLPAWSFLYLLATVGTAIYALHINRREFSASWKFRLEGIGYAIRQGSLFSLGGSFDKACVDADKLMLARLSTLEVTGAYSAAYRLVELVGVPIASFFSAALPRFFQIGKHGMNHSVSFTKRILPFPMVYALGSCLVLFFFAELLPFILGSSFESTVAVLRILAWIPMLTVPRWFLQTIFTTNGRQRIVVIVLAFGACINVIVNLYAIPKWGWQGAACATYISEGAMIVLLFSLLFFRHAIIRTSKVELCN